MNVLSLKYFVIVSVRRQLDQNEISELPANVFESQGALRNLRLESNQLSRVPTLALQPLRSLEAL